MFACLPGIVILALLLGVSRKWPQGIHPWFGYRSSRSLRSMEAWEVAQPIAAEYMQWTGWLVLNLGITCWLLDVPDRIGITVTLAAFALLLIGVRVLTERALAKRFDP